MKVRIKRLGDDVALPAYQTDGSVAFDLHVRERTTVPAGEIALVGTGLVVETPAGYALVIASRSSAPKKLGLTPPHGIGIIDQDYSGDEDELKILVRNFTDEPVELAAGVRLAQGMFVRVETAEWDEVETMGKDSRGGFGSTGGHE